MLGFLHSCWRIALACTIRILRLPLIRKRIRNGDVILLTRDEHARGSWLLDLEEALSARDVATSTLSLSAFTGVKDSWRCLVNRVSDAAPPADVKVALATIRACELRGIPVVNGSYAYSIGISKMLHYELFGLTGLATPPFVVVRRGGPALVDVAVKAMLKYPLLIKPNAAGFGAGIVRVESAEELSALGPAALDGAFGSDGIALLQEFVVPEGGRTYRVWWAGGVVQRAVSVQPACFSYNACVRSVPSQSWPVPAAVHAAVLELALLARADCGSVELLYSRGKALYFDFNLLSTLPEKADYSELARAVVREKAL